MGIFYIISFAIFLLAGCAEPESKSICRDRGKIRPCTLKEQKVIDGMQDIIKAVRAYRPQATDDLTPVKIKLYGEIHTDAAGKIANLGLINYDFKEGDTLLSEGLDRKYYIPKTICALQLIKDIFYAREFSKLNLEYSPKFMHYLNDKENYELIFETTKESYDISALNISRLQCGFWDKEQSGLAGLTEYKKHKVRNHSMTEALYFWLPYSGRVLVVAGLSHLPKGDRLITVNYNSQSPVRIPKDMYSYYDLMKNQRKLPENWRSLNHDPAAGSTKPIYEYLARNNISYKEYFHGQRIP